MHVGTISNRFGGLLSSISSYNICKTPDPLLFLDVKFFFQPFIYFSPRINHRNHPKCASSSHIHSFLRTFLHCHSYLPIILDPMSTPCISLYLPLRTKKSCHLAAVCISLYFLFRISP